MYLFFDIDDTFLDTVSTRRNAVYDLVKLYPEQLGEDVIEFEKSWRTLADNYHEQWYRGQLTLVESQRARIRYFFGPHLRDDESDALFRLYVDLNA
ncbi:MAG: hypothetical protein ACYC6L_02275, partial [Anaerolineae bacterium]